MHPDLLNNSLFLRYYKQWQDDPSSVVFAPIAEYFLMYDMLDAALKVCREGLKHHPNLVSGRIVMARLHLKRGNWEEAEAELHRVLSIVPENHMARQILHEVEGLQREERSSHAGAPRPRTAASSFRPPAADASWHTVTMAGIFAAQGHFDKAREIYRTILERDPHNAAARQGIDSLPAAS